MFAVTGAEMVILTYVRAAAVVALVVMLSAGFVWGSVITIRHERSESSEPFFPPDWYAAFPWVFGGAALIAIPPPTPWTIVAIIFVVLVLFIYARRQRR